MLDEAEAPTEPNAPLLGIELREVTKSFRLQRAEVVALAGIDLTVRDGAFV